MAIVIDTNTIHKEPRPHLSINDRLFDFQEPDVELTAKPEVISDKKASFLAPNEEYPADAVRILDQAVSGVYLSVGTERGFIGAALAPNISHLLLVDRDPRVVFFNRINIALLTVAQSREEYLDLRLKSSREAWLNLAEDQKLPRQFKDLLRDSNTYNWWVSEVRDEAKFALLHGGPVNTDEDPEFGRANYLYDQRLFDRISALAKRGQIDARLCDFNDAQDLLALCRQIERSNEKLAVVDLSNAWWRGYIGENLRDGLKLLLPLMEQGGILMLTSLKPKTAETKNKRFWSYIGFTREHILSWGSMDIFDEALSRFRNIPADLAGQVLSTAVEAELVQKFSPKPKSLLRRVFGIFS